LKNPLNNKPQKNLKVLKKKYAGAEEGGGGGHPPPPPPPPPPHLPNKKIG